MGATELILDDVALDDKWERKEGRIFLSGVQALVRLLIEQRQRDIAAGLNTAGFVSGYRGSPLGTLDTVLWREQRRLTEQQIVFQPGLNEDLAATSLWGTQQVDFGGASKVDGVFGMWYGKGPGVDRSLDPLKHANLAGASPYGGVIAVAGDDHISQSSTLAHQSEQTFIAAMIPVLNPSSVQDYLDFGALGYALSRFSGCWVGFKAVAETVESTASIVVDPSRLKLQAPSDFVAPPDGLHIRWPDMPLAAEARLHGPRMQAVAAFARANKIDRLVSNPRTARLGVVSTGKSYLDVKQALIELGIDRRVEDLGVRVYKVGMSWPLEAEGVRRFADGLDEILVVEEKQGLIENQLKDILYNMPADKRPRVVGKKDEAGAPLLRSEGQLGANDVACALLARMKFLGFSDPSLEQNAARLALSEERIVAPGSSQFRMPIFCSGCPHNTSTRVPAGSRALAGIGCHSIASLGPKPRAGAYTQMGGEGANWIGQAPFSKDKHVFQNLGDGTYAHSGLIAIRAAVAAGVNITYKILYNDAVAMTGGQPAEGQFTVSDIVDQVLAEHVAKVVVVSDDPERQASAGYSRQVEVKHRDDLDEVQRTLRDIPGATILIYEQTCAAEKRRRRKRGLMPDPPRRVFINEEVCEGCGDCSDASNCVSVTPIETELGRKRAIDQSTCNKDYSCVKGFCPSFVIVDGGEWKGAKAGKTIAPNDPLECPSPLSKPSLDRPYNILVAGIGGTGIVTVGALLGMAAHIEGKGCTISDVTGLSQKGGAVTSHVRIAASPDDLHSVKIAPGAANLLLGYDQVVSTSADILSRLEHGVTKAVVNKYVAPTALFVQNPDIDFEHESMRKSLCDQIGDDGVDFLDAARRATALLGDSIASNLFMLGFAFQKGLVPLSAESIERAIQLNGAAVKMNLRAFSWGRVQANAPEKIDAIVGANDRHEPLSGLDSLIKRRYDMLVSYQNKAYADRFLKTVNAVRVKEESEAWMTADFTAAVIKSLYKLMAYKDEYEVARLYVDTSFRQKIASQYEGSYSLKFSFAPPLFAQRDPATGRLKKHLYGGWMFWALKVLSFGKVLRGTKLDPFGYLKDRKTERGLIAEYEGRVAQLLRDMNASNYALAREIAALPMSVKGFGHVKDRTIDNMWKEEAALMEAFYCGGAKKAAA